MLGAIKIRGIGLGVAGVLFAGLIYSHFWGKPEKETLEFVREFGLILFVYTIGVQVGPGFLASLRRNGMKLNLMAAGIVLSRLYPLPIRVLGWLAARRRDIVPILGLRSVGRQPAAASRRCWC
jgi:putative transport protein